VGRNTTRHCCRTIQGTKMASVRSVFSFSVSVRIFTSTSAESFFNVLNVRFIL
jgi:hypothetical protein